VEQRREDPLPRNLQTLHTSSTEPQEEAKPSGPLVSSANRRRTKGWGGRHHPNVLTAGELNYTAEPHPCLCRRHQFNTKTRTRNAPWGVGGGKRLVDGRVSCIFTPFTARRRKRVIANPRRGAPTVPQLGQTVVGRRDYRGVKWFRKREV